MTRVTTMAVPRPERKRQTLVLAADIADVRDWLHRQGATRITSHGHGTLPDGTEVIPAPARSFAAGRGCAVDCIVETVRFRDEVASRRQEMMRAVVVPCLAATEGGQWIQEVPE